MLRKLLRWTAILVGVLAALVVVAVGAAYAISGARLRRHYAVRTVEMLTLPTDSASIARGHHLAETIVQCTECHGEDVGGRVSLDKPLVARIAGPNLTRGRGGLGARLTVADWERAIRHGIAPDGSPLRMMPSTSYVNIRDDDVAAIIAWARQVPPVDREVPPTTLGPVGRVLHAGRIYPVVAAERLSPEVTHPTGPAPGPTREYGRYLSGIAGCAECHGEHLSGGRIPGAPPGIPPAANLTPAGLGHYTEADFVRALREGRRPGGAPIDTVMPWRRHVKMGDDELRALFAYLRTLPARPYGGR